MEIVKHASHKHTHNPETYFALISSAFWVQMMHSNAWEELPNKVLTKPTIIYF